MPKVKAVLATITVECVIPAQHVPEGLTLPDLAYRAATGLIALQRLHYKTRPATREETAANADFLQEWSFNLEAFQYALDNGKLTAVDAAAEKAKTTSIPVSNEKTDTH